jgi:hypothetical protein
LDCVIPGDLGASFVVVGKEHDTRRRETFTELNACGTDVGRAKSLLKLGV